MIIRSSEERDLTASVIDHIANLINRVHDEAESGMWKRVGTRMSSEEMAEIDPSIAGAVSIMIIDSRTGEFGPLVTDPAHRGRGIGSKVVEAGRHVLQKVQGLNPIHGNNGKG